MKSMTTKILAQLIADRLVDAGMPAFPSVQFGFVDKAKVQELVEGVLSPFKLDYKDERFKPKSQFDQKAVTKEIDEVERRAEGGPART